MTSPVPVAEDGSGNTWLLTGRGPTQHYGIWFPWLSTVFSSGIPEASACPAVITHIHTPTQQTSLCIQI